jgi:hypothetical protein
MGDAAELPTGEPVTVLEARIRRRLLRPYEVQVFTNGGEECRFNDSDVVRVRRRRDGIRIWTYWSDDREVMEWWFPSPDEVRVSRA